MTSETQASERQPLLSHPHDTNHTDNHESPTSIPRGDEPAAAQVAAGSPEDDEALSTSQLLKIMSGVFLAATLASLDGTLIATLVTPISNSFDSGTLFAWLASAYFIANAASQPLAGKLSDIYGRRTGMFFSNILFGIGNLICGLAQSESSIILGRIVAGLGGGGLGPIATSLASDLVPLRRRGLWQGFFNICYGIGASLGGPVGGLIHDAIGWRWAFLLQVPLTLVTLILVYFFLRSPVPTKTSPADGDTDTETKAKWKRVDFAGATCLVSSLVLMLTGLNAAGNIVPWTHPLILTTLPVSLLLLALFVLVEHKFATEPIIPLHLLAHRTILASCFANWFVSATTFALFFYLPMFFYVQGFSTTQIGLRLIPQSVAIGITSLTYGMIMRSTGRYYWLGVLSGVVNCIGCGLTVFFVLETSSWLPILSFVLVGFGSNGMVMVTIIAMIASAEHQYRAVVTSISYAFRSTGTTTGIALASVIFQNRLNIQLRRHLAHLPDAESIIRNLRNNLEGLRGLPEPVRDAASRAYMDALHAAFVFIAGICVVGLGALVLLREHKLHGTVSRKD